MLTLGACDENGPLDAVLPAVVFVSGNQQDAELYLWSGDTLTRLTSNAFAESEPHVAAGRLAFTSERDGDPEIYIGDVRATNVRRLTTDPAADGEAAIHPTGDRIVFVSTRSGTPRLWTMDTLGGSLAPLATGSDTFIPGARPGVESARRSHCVHVGADGYVAGVGGLRARRRGDAGHGRGWRRVRSGVECHRGAHCLRDRCRDAASEKHRGRRRSNGRLRRRRRHVVRRAVVLAGLLRRRARRVRIRWGSGRVRGATGARARDRRATTAGAGAGDGAARAGRAARE